MSPVNLVLASTSRYRSQLLAQLRLPFVTSAPEVDEFRLAREAPRALALRLARAKASAVAMLHRDALIIGADQVAMVDDVILNKPGDHVTAARQLRAMSGKRVQFHTGVCLINSRSGNTQTDVETVIVHMRELGADQIERYLAADKPYDCAGSARIEALGIALVSRLECPDPSALIGLPLIKLCDMLRNEGVELP